MLKNWLFWIIISSSVLILGAITERIFDWPYLTYIGVAFFTIVCLLWTILAIIKNVNK